MKNLRIIGYGKDKGNKIIRFDNNIRHRMDDTQSHYTMSVNAVEKALLSAECAIDEKRIKKGNTILLFGTAAGMTISGLIMRI